MANYKDNNADLGNQTIEGTSPPDALEAIIVMPDNSDGSDIGAQPSVDPVIIPAAPSAADLDAQLDALLNGDGPSEPVATEIPSDLDAQLEALMAEPVIVTESVTTVRVESDNDNLDAMLDDLLKSDGGDKTTAASDSEPKDTVKQASDMLVGESAPDVDELNKQLDELLNADSAVTPDASRSAQSDTAQAASAQEPVSQPAQGTPAAEQPANSGMTDEARAMMEQAQRIMEQAQAAQIQAAAQMQAAQIQAQVAQATQAQSAPVREVSHDRDSATAEAAREMMRQAQAMLQQAQEAQLQAQKAAAEAQIQAQAASAARTMNVAPTQTSDLYSAKEVDRLKSELDGMRDLVNKLTFSIAQNPNGAAQQNMQAPPPVGYGYNPEQQDQYRKLETELDRMRREILEKDLRDREKELDRRQKEAENSVKDIRPEMVQMSDSRDIAPVAGQSAAFGGEYIPLANGVFYSIKDKQVYVMTPASNAAAASPTIEPKRTSVKKRPVAHARPAAKRRPVAHARRRPAGAPMHRRPPNGRGGSGRPTHR